VHFKVLEVVVDWPDIVHVRQPSFARKFW